MKTDFGAGLRYSIAMDREFVVKKGIFLEFKKYSELSILLRIDAESITPLS